MMMIILTFFFLVVLISYSNGLNNGLGRTPQMDNILQYFEGWNSWNHFNCRINETIVRQIADAIVATGLAEVGYQYVNLDDCWQFSRDSEGTIQSDPITFPSGIPALVDYVHSRKLKFGLYSARGNMTCQRRPGSLGYEIKDANTYAVWNVDYLKLDSCFFSNIVPTDIEYKKMRDALNATGRPIFYSLCGGIYSYDLWVPTVGNSWRTTGDIKDNWATMISNIDHNIPFVSLAGPGGWNDPDMLEVGNGGMSDTEYRTHFSLWSISKAPLIIGCDVTNISATALEILTNREVIAVNQDPLGIQGTVVATATLSSPNASGEVMIANRSLLNIEPIRYQWIYNSQDGSIRSAYNERCLSIDYCKPFNSTPIYLEDCEIGDPHARCRGKNQQWIHNTITQNIVSQMNGDCLDLYSSHDSSLIIYPCNGKDNQIWLWNETDGTIRSKSRDEYLIVRPELEIWAGPLTGGSQAVVLLNRGINESSEITVNWTDIGFPVDHLATVRDLWAHQDLGVFNGKYTSPRIDAHASMMLNITLIE